jgi:hypothetical protein
MREDKSLLKMLSIQLCQESIKPLEDNQEDSQELLEDLLDQALVETKDHKSMKSIDYICQ